MGCSNENTFKFAVVGFPGAGKSTYAAALYRARKKAGYEVLEGEAYLRDLEAHLDASKNMSATQKGETFSVAFKGPEGSFCFKDYAGERVVGKNSGEVTPNFCSSIIGDSIGALILINPKEVEEQLNGTDVESCVSRYDSIIRFLANSRHLQSVVIVRTAQDYYRSLGQDRQEQFDEFERKLKKRLDDAYKQSSCKFAIVSCTVSCGNEGLDDFELFSPFSVLIKSIGSHVNENGNDPISEEKPVAGPSGEKASQSNAVWLCLLVMLVLVGSFMLWRSLPLSQGEEQPIIRPPVPHLPGVDDIDIEIEKLRKMSDPIESIDKLNEMSDDYQGNPKLLTAGAIVEERVNNAYRRMMGDMRVCYGAFEGRVRQFEKPSGEVDYANGALEEKFSDFKTLSAKLGATRNGTLRQNKWFVFVTNAFKNKQITTYAGSFQQEYEITDFSVKVDNNPYRKICVTLSSFQYLTNGTYKVDEIVDDMEVINNLTMTYKFQNVLNGAVKCSFNPWHCGGVKLQVTGKNRKVWQNQSDVVVKLFNDEEYKCQFDGTNVIDGVMKFGEFEDKGFIELRYRLTYRRLNGDVKSPFALEGGVQ